MKKQYVILFAVLAFIVLIQTTVGSAYASSNLVAHNQRGSSAKTMCVLEGNTNTVLYGKEMNREIAMASTTKIITGIIAIEHFTDLDEVIKVADQSVGIEGTSIYLNKGEEISIRDLLYGLILASGNDAATALAFAVSGSEEAFVSKMNEFATSIGANNTSFANAHGLDSKGHYTTAYDLALMTSYALKNDTFKTIVSTKFRQLAGTTHSGERYLRNKNRLVFTQENNIGVKTGFTDNAGRCLVNAIEQDGMMIVTVVLNCTPMFEEASDLTSLALREFEMKEFVTPYNFVGSVPIENGDKSNVNIVSIQGFKIPIKKDEIDNYDVRYNMPESLTAPIEKNDIIGDLEVYYLGELVYKDNLYSIDEVKNVNIKFMLENIIENWFQ